MWVLFCLFVFVSGETEDFLFYYSSPPTPIHNTALPTPLPTSFPSVPSVFPTPVPTTTFVPTYAAGVPTPHPSLYPSYAPSAVPTLFPSTHNPTPTFQPTIIGNILNAEFSGSGYVEFIVPAGVYSLLVFAYGAQGGSCSTCYPSLDGVGGLGGMVEAVVSVTSGQVFYVYVGGAGVGTKTSDEGGYNGGGKGGTDSCKSSIYFLYSYRNILFRKGRLFFNFYRINAVNSF